MSAARAINANEITRRLAELSGAICGQLQERLIAAEERYAAVEERYAAIVVLGAVVEAMRRQLPTELQRAAEDLSRSWRAHEELPTLDEAAERLRATSTATFAARAYDACLEPDATAQTWNAAEEALVDTLKRLDHCTDRAANAEREWLSSMLANVRERRLSQLAD
jgi:hypothetical protein